MPPMSNDILAYLMNKGRANKYTIDDYLGGSRYSAVYKAVDRLARDGLVRAVKEDLANTGLAVKTYDMTVLGLALSLANLIERVDWTQMPKKHKDLLPKILGNWDFFVKSNGAELAKRSLLESVDQFWDEYDFETRIGKTAEGLNDSDSEKISNYFILSPRGAFTDEETLSWYDLIEKNSELKSWATRILHLVIDDRLSELDGRIFSLLRFGGHLSQNERRMISHLADHTNA